MNTSIGQILATFAPDRGNLLPILLAVREATGCLSSESIAEISRFVDITENDTFGVASFHAELGIASIVDRDS